MVFNKRSSGSDNFYTPTWVTKMLLDYIPNLKGSIIWECASGHNNMSAILQTVATNVHSTDIIKGQDFLNYKPDFKFDYIVTNPPFSYKNEFLEKCFEYGKPFCLLLPLNTLETKKRQMMIQYSNMGVDVIIPDRRVSYINAKNSPNFASAWFCFGFWDVLGTHRFRIHFADSSRYM